MNTIEISQVKTQRSKPIPNGVIGMVLLVITEIMFFAGLISAYLVNRAGAPVWPPSNQPRLPIEVTAVNTFILIASGVFFFLLIKQFDKKPGRAGIWLSLSILCGLIFLGIQGYEWVQMIGFGLTTTSSVFGAFFYSIIGMHGFHVLIGIAFLFYLWISLRRNKSKESKVNSITAISIFWFFVVGIWPLLYYMVYLF